MFNKILLSLVLLCSIGFASLKQQTTTLQNVSSDTGVINIGNLTIGQTGVIIHNFDESKSIIIADFEVVSTSPQNSKVKFEYKNFENKVAIPTPNITVKNGDTAILNHMYNTSILIAPNYESFSLVQKNFLSQNFLHSDIFGAYLKSIGQPVPSKEEFREFCNINNIGTIFFVIDSRVYVVDSKTFVVLEEYKVKKETSEENMTPFYTNIEDIKLGILNFGASSIENYTNYYSKLIGI